MPRSNSVALLVLCIIFLVGIGITMLIAESFTGFSIGFIVSLILAIIVSSALNIANQWERAVVLRLGKFMELIGPGIFFIIPVIDRVAYWIDIRTITTTFKAETTLTKDTVPVDVEAVLFWKVTDPEKAALAVERYDMAVSQASQTALREIIGKTMLAELLEDRAKIDRELQTVIDLRAEQWGVNILSVEIKDIVIPPGLQHAMSMQAQAERERQARIILGDSEKQVATKFEDAAKTYRDNPTALHLRAMNMLFEGLKAGSPTLVIVPAPVLNTMALGSDITGLVALAENVKKKSAELPDTPK